ncbi:hypothetical protein ACFQE0_11235 [Methylobacterium komagatae]|uniref:PH domain-containing protein n=1 Tax=Methylobacterium komagatae TaxID=374425 RepID=A0ABW2BKM7_9HYPH
MSQPSAATKPGHFALTTAAAWVVLFALYMLLAGSLSLDEAATGAGAATLACIWWAVGGRGGGMRFSGWTGFLGPIWRSLIALPGATIRVGRQLLGFVLHGAPPGHTTYERDAASAWATADAPAERALGLIAKSLAPDSFVLREKGGDAGIVEHSLSESEARR